MAVESEPDVFFFLLIVCVKVDVSPQVTQTFLSLSVLLQHHHSLLGLPPRDGDGLVRSSPHSLKSHTEQKLNTLEPQPLLPSSPLLLKLSLLLLLTGAPCYPERLSLAALLLRMTSSIHELFFYLFFLYLRWYTRRVAKTALCIRVQCLKWPVCLYAETECERKLSPFFIVWLLLLSLCNGCTCTGLSGVANSCHINFFFSKDCLDPEAAEHFLSHIWMHMLSYWCYFLGC